MKSSRFALFVFATSMLFFAACGVKGPPLPPEDPPVLGRGIRSFSKSASFAQPAQPQPIEDVENEDDENRVQQPNQNE